MKASSSSEETYYTNSLKIIQLSFGLLASNKVVPFEYKLREYISQLTFLPLRHSLPTLLCRSSEYAPLQPHHLLWLISSFFYNSAVYWKQFLSLFLSNGCKWAALPKEILRQHSSHGSVVSSLLFHRTWESFEHLPQSTCRDFQMLEGRDWTLPSSSLSPQPRRTEAELRPHRTTVAAWSFPWPTTERKQLCPSSWGRGRGADFLVAAPRPSVTPEAPRHPPVFCHLGYKGSVLCLAPPEDHPEDGTSSASVCHGKWSRKHSKGKGRKMSRSSSQQQERYSPGHCLGRRELSCRDAPGDRMDTPPSSPCQGARMLAHQSLWRVVWGEREAMQEPRSQRKPAGKTHSLHIRKLAGHWLGPGIQTAPDSPRDSRATMWQVLLFSSCSGLHWPFFLRAQQSKGVP